jgi:hypothetical protein
MSDKPGTRTGEPGTVAALPWHLKTDTLSQSKDDPVANDFDFSRSDQRQKRRKSKTESNSADRAARIFGIVGIVGIVGGISMCLLTACAVAGISIMAGFEAFVDKNRKVEAQVQEEPKHPEPAPVQLTIIYRHTARLSKAKLVKASDPIPPGWEGGDGWRRVGIEQPRWEASLDSLLANGKEGDAAEIRH